MKLHLDHVHLELVNRTGVPTQFQFRIERDEGTMDVQQLAVKLTEAQRALGSYGYRPQCIPPGGFRFPYNAEERFDWRLLGAERLVMRGDNGQDEVVVRFGQEYYKRRLLDANPKKNMPMAIRYSRGAHSGDSAETADGDDFRYVALAVFRGGGPIDHLIVNA